jgi:hypothetical protein
LSPNPTERLYIMLSLIVASSQKRRQDHDL